MEGREREMRCERLLPNMDMGRPVNISCLSDHSSLKCQSSWFHKGSKKVVKQSRRYKSEQISQAVDTKSNRQFYIPVFSIRLLCPLAVVVKSYITPRPKLPRSTQGLWKWKWSLLKNARNKLILDRHVTNVDFIFDPIWIAHSRSRWDNYSFLTYPTLYFSCRRDAPVVRRL